MLKEKTSKFAVLQMEMLEEIAGTSSIFAENGMNGSANAAVRKNQNMLVRVPFTKHSEKTVDTKFEDKQRFFAIMRLEVARIVVPDFCELEEGKFSVDFAKIAFE